MAKGRTILRIFLAVSYTVGNYLALSVVHRYVLLPLVGTSADVSYYGTLSQTMLIALVLLASIVNGAMAADKTGYMTGPLPLRALMMSIVNMGIYSALFLTNPNIRNGVSAAGIAGLLALCLLIIFGVTYASVIGYNRLRTDNRFVAFVSTNPVGYLAAAVIVTAVLSRIVAKGQ